MMGTMLVATIAVCAMAINRWTYLETVPAGPTPSPSKSPSASPTPSVVVYKIGGLVTEAGKPLDGVKIMLEGDQVASTVTNAHGRYTFVGLPAGSGYSVAPDPSSQTKYNRPRSIINNLQQDEAVDFAVQLFEINGQVTEVLHVPGQVSEVRHPLSRVKITLYKGKKEINSTKTDDRGNYVFGRVPAGSSYTVMPDLGKTFGPLNRTVDDLKGNETVDFSVSVRRDATPTPKPNPALTPSPTPNRRRIGALRTPASTAGRGPTIAKEKAHVRENGSDPQCSYLQLVVALAPLRFRRERHFCLKAFFSNPQLGEHYVS